MKRKYVASVSEHFGNKNASGRALVLELKAL